jgi:hypothetical protein
VIAQWPNLIPRAAITFETRIPEIRRDQRQRTTFGASGMGDPGHLGVSVRPMAGLLTNRPIALLRFPVKIGVIRATFISFKPNNRVDVGEMAGDTVEQIRSRGTSGPLKYL